MAFDLNAAVAARKRSSGYPVEVLTMTGQTLTVFRRPWTRDCEKEFAAVTLEKEEDWMTFRARQLLTLLSGWDVVNDGEPVPLTADYLLMLESNDLEAIRQAVAKDLWQVPTTAGSTTGSEASGGTS